MRPVLQLPLLQVLRKDRHEVYTESDDLVWVVWFTLDETESRVFWRGLFIGFFILLLNETEPRDLWRGRLIAVFATFFNFCSLPACSLCVGSRQLLEFLPLGPFWSSRNLLALLTSAPSFGGGLGGGGASGGVRAPLRTLLFLHCLS